MSGRRRVVVTGYGALSSLGENSTEVWASILKRYRIKPVHFWDSETVRGYERKDFEQAWNRYCASVTA